MNLAARIITIAAISILSSASAYADASFEGTQNGLVRNSFDLYGGAPSDVAIDSSGRVYVSMNASNGAFCLEKGASEWTDPPAGTDLGAVQAIALGSSAGTAFVIGGTSLFRTTDGCATWTELTGSSGSSDGNDYGFEIAFGHNTLLVEARDGTLDRSTDNGDSFTNVTVTNGAQRVVALAVSPTSGEFYALVSTGGNDRSLFKSTDSGQTWGDAGKTGSYADVAVDAQDADRIALSTTSGGVELSTNGGSSWNTLSPPDTSKSRVTFINGRLYKGDAYTDDLSNWSLLGESSGGADIVAPVAGHPSDSNILYVGTELGVARSSNGGASFGDANTGIFAVSVQDIAQEADKNTVYLATEQGLAKTTNFLAEGGPTWTFPVQISSTRAYQGVYSIHIDQSDSSRLYAALLGGELYFSADAGSTWTEATVSDINGADVPDIAQTQDGTLYAAFRSRESNTGGVLRSTDSGVNWTIVSTGSVDIDCNSIAVIGNTIFVGAGDDQDLSNTASGIYSYDGSTWTKLSGAVDGQLVLAIVSVGNVLIAASGPDSDQSGGVFRSSDAGATWTEVTSRGLRTDGGWYRTLAVDPENTDIIYVAHGRPAGSAEIYYSQDRGVTWALLYEGLIDEVPAAMLVDDLTVGSGVGFTGITIGSSVRFNARVVNNSLQCTLNSDEGKLANQKVSLQVKKKRRGQFLRKRTRSTSVKGKATFSLRNIPRGAAVRCNFLRETSRARKY